MRRTRYLQSLFAAAALAVPLLAAADPRYAVTVVAGADSRASDINNQGQVVGSLYTGSAYRGFVYAGSVLTELGTFGGANSSASGINDLGQVVGSADGADGYGHGFIYSGGAMNAMSGGTYLQPYGINNSGAITGTMFAGDPAPSSQRAFIWSSGSVTDLGTLSYGDNSRGFAINNHGDVVGAAANMVEGAPNFPEDPFVYRNGVMTGLGNLGGPWSAATSINDQGQVVGYLGVDSFPGNPGDIYPRSAFLYENGQMHMLEGVPMEWSSVANDINNLGQIVGYTGGADGGFSFVYDKGEVVDLNTLIDPASGWTITSANAINDVQQIAANACRAGICQAVRLDLVSAVPEPPVFALLAAGLALGLARGRGFRLPVRRRRG